LDKPVPGSCELKFIICQDKATQIAKWAQNSLEPDPHTDPQLENSYLVQSLYLDTEGFEIFHSSAPFGEHKFRIRRYGSESCLYLEQKTKKGFRVRKLRTHIGEDELERLQQPPAGAPWDGCWFHDRILEHALRPVCVIAYHRQAYTGQEPSGPFRLTLDSSVAGAASRDWFIGIPRHSTPLIPERMILELKYRSALPARLKQLIQDFALSPGPGSKYRTGMSVAGVAKS
jgi:hypothetical protein